MVSLPRLETPIQSRPGVAARSPATEAIRSASCADALMVGVSISPSDSTSTCTYSSSTLCRQPAAQYSSPRRQYGSAPFMPRIRAITSGVLNRLRKPQAIRPAECLKLGSVDGTPSVYASARRLHVAGPASAASARSAGKSSGTRPCGFALPSANSAAELTWSAQPFLSPGPGAQASATALGFAKQAWVASRLCWRSSMMGAAQYHALSAGPVRGELAVSGTRDRRTDDAVSTVPRWRVSMTSQF